MARKGGWTKLGRDKLESSGLTTEIGEALGMYEVASATTLLPQFDARAGLVIPYHDIHGKPTRPRGGDAFYRVRYLERDHSFSSATEKEVRYVQPYGSPSCAYLPHIGGFKWADIARDTFQELVITEGELKAAAACMQGFPTIGLGGVYSFRDAKNGYWFLKELEEFDWRKRGVYITYDSDFTTNAKVLAAINALMEELQERGADVKVVALPNVMGEDKKTGLDDYFLHQSNKDFTELLSTAEPIGIGRTLWNTNAEVVYVNDPGMIINQKSGQKMSPGNFKEHSHWSTLSTVNRMMTPGGGVAFEKVSAAAAWIKWPFRRAAHRLTYAPGQPRFTDKDDYNTWTGWGCEPRKGSVKPFLELVDFIFSDSEAKAKEWFLDWCAYPIQHPGHKLFSAVIVHSVEQGTGKSLVGYTLGEIYGKNFKEITDKDLESDYTSWAENRQFIMGDEITGSDNRRHAAMLKRIISQRQMTINIKHLPQYEIPDVMNYYYTAQHVDSFFLEDSDRRFFVVELNQPPLADVFYQRYDDWLWREGGPSYLFQWLLDRKIGKDFNPNAKAMVTKAKQRMILAGKGELAAWVHDLKTNPIDLLVFGNMRHTRDLFSAGELLKMYEAVHPNSKVTSVGLGRALSAAGFMMVDGGQPLRGADGKMARHYAVRNAAKWARATTRKAMEENVKMQPIRTGK